MPDGTDASDALSALERLVHRHKILTLDQARAAARVITGNPDYELPAQPAPPAPAAAPPPSPAPAPPADNASPAGSESL